MKWLHRIAVCALCLAALAVLIVAASWLLIDWNEDGSEDFPCGMVLRDCTGEIMRVTLGPGDTDCRPFYVADEDDWIVKAIVAVEDGEFWTHYGVRPLSIARAFVQNVFYGRRISGASTLTMQTVRLIHPHKKSYYRKWVEAFEAMKMERRRTKKWILSQYLNRAPFGANFVGIEAASQGWFGKGAKELGLGEAALLAAMVQAPSRFRPDRGSEAGFKRRDHVLDRMMQLGMIDAVQAEAARTIRPIVRRIHRPFLHPYYCDWFLGRLPPAHCGLQSKDIVTPLEPDIQNLCENIVNEAASAGGYSVAAVVLQLPSNASPAQSPNLPIRKSTNSIIALACSGDYFDKTGGQVNTAMAPRPAGSTLKPFLVAQAMELGIVTPDTRLNDAPVAYKGYRPANFDSSYRGLVTMRDALILSLNIPFVQLLERVGLQRFGTYLRMLGFSNMSEPSEKFGLGMAIGNVEVSLVELVQAYAQKFADCSSRITADTSPSSSAETTNSLSAAAYLVGDMLSGEERASAALGHIADVQSLPRFAWKTGTSSGYRDAWCVLWNPEYVIGIWCGHKRGGFGDKTLVGAIAAAPLAWRIARELYPQGDGPWFNKPDNIATRRICSASGLVATGICSETEEAPYIRGISAPTLCNICGQSATRKSTLSIAHPQDGATFSFVDGMGRQGIVCEALPKDLPLWWFIDGTPAGRSTSAAPLVIHPDPGRHTLSCVDADGSSASVSFSIQ